MPFLTRRTWRTAARIRPDPSAVAQFGRSQHVPEGNEDHGRVPVSMPVRFGCFHEASTSPAVRYSRVRRSAFGRPVGTAVRFTSVEGTSVRYCSYF
jgi:hypothetical protein